MQTPDPASLGLITLTLAPEYPRPGNITRWLDSAGTTPAPSKNPATALRGRILDIFPGQGRRRRDRAFASTSSATAREDH